MALKIKLKQEDGTLGDVYLKACDIKSISFGIEKMKNPTYNPEAVDSDELPDKEVLEEFKSIDYCKITFYDTIEQKVPYESVTRVNGKDKVVIKEKKEMTNNFWAIFDKTQFEYIRSFAETMN